MATSQNSKEEYRKTSRQLKELQLKLEDLQNKQDLIIAKHTKDILSDSSLDKVTYNERAKLLNAELTLRLEVDPDYKAASNRKRELRLKKNDLEVEMELMGVELFGKLPLRGLSLDEDDSYLDDLD